MASYNQPLETLPIFDNVVFSANTTVLTLAQANLLYLKKTVPDTATSLETFNGGILTNSINPTSNTSNLTISSSSNTGTIVIDTANTGNSNLAPAISIGTSAIQKTIKIGSSAVAQSVHCAQLDITGATLNNITGTTGNVSIGSAQTSGTLYIGASAAGNIRTGGQINIGTDSTQTGTIHIGDTGGSTGNISIGSANFTTQVGGGLVVAGGLGANGGLTLANPLTLPSTYTASSTTQLGYLYSSSLVSGLAFSSGSAYVYTPSTGTATNILKPGVYMTSMIYYCTPSVTPQTSNVDQQFGMCYCASTAPLVTGANVTSVGVIADNNTYIGFNQSRWFRNGSIIFTVPTGNTNYYFMYGYGGLGSSSGGTFTLSVQLLNLVKIA